MKAEEYYKNHFAPFEITVVSKETVIELMEQYAQQEKEPLIKLLKVARCPNGNCDNNGTLTEVERGADGWPEPYPAECEWCYNRKILTTNHQNQEQ